MALSSGMSFIDTWPHSLLPTPLGSFSNMTLSNVNTVRNASRDLRSCNQDNIYCSPIVSNRSGSIILHI